MAKDFKSKSPLTNLAAPEASTESEIQKTTPAKKRVGRPTTKDVKGTCKNINVAVKVELLDKCNEVKKALGGNLTAYINGLIEKDMETNYDNYKTIVEIQSGLGL